MLRFLGLGALALWASITPCQSNIREVDFRNFTFPLSGGLLGHSNLQWLGAGTGMRSRPPIHLVSGRAIETEPIPNSYSQNSGFTFESVSFGDVTGDGADEAIVDLKFHSGGTQTTDYVYIYSFENGRTKLLAYCHTGDRSNSGLYKTYASDGRLVVELLDPKKSEGDCCSRGVVLTRFRWDGKAFRIEGKVEQRNLPPGIHD